MKTIDFSYFIERYNAGEMSDVENKWFQKELNGNDELQKEVNLRKGVDEVLVHQDIISLRDKLSVIEKRSKENVPHNKSKKATIAKYAALVTGLILVGSVTFFPGRNISNEEIMSRYYNTYEPPAAQRSGNIETDNDFSQALVLYQSHDYVNAALLFNKVLESSPNYMQSKFLHGVSKFEIEQYPEAERSFSSVIENNNNHFIEDAQWYLALCYVNTNNTDLAVQQLEIVLNSGGIFVDEAKKILKRYKK